MCVCVLGWDLFVSVCVCMYVCVNVYAEKWSKFLLFYKIVQSARTIKWKLLRRFSGKESSCPCRRCRRHRFDPWIGKIPWKRKWQPSPVFLPGKSHRQRILKDYSLWVHKELDTTEHVSTLNENIVPLLYFGGTSFINQVWIINIS